MKIKYEFVNGDVSEIDVEAEWAEIISASRRKEDSKERTNRRYFYSLDALKYGDKDIYAPSDDMTPEAIKVHNENNRKIHDAFSKLSEIQQRRLLMLASGMSMREIAKREGVHHRAVEDCIKAAGKKFKKYFQNTSPKHP